ncbi:MAG: hypothetical protein JNL99_01910 [Zoogloea sp.]|nr:hypothetical protein [Zoogloea sp.]
MGAIDLPATAAAPLPLLMRELDLLIKIEKRADAALVEEDRIGVFTISEELARISDLCVMAQAKIGRALALAYVQEGIVDA